MLHVTLLGEQAITDDETGSVRVRSSRTVALIASGHLHKAHQTVCDGTRYV